MSSNLILDIDQYILTKSHPTLRNFYKIKSKATNEFFICKMLEFNNHSILLKLLDEYDLFSKCFHPNIVHFEGIGERINPITNNFQFFLLYEKMEKNLKDFIGSKREKKLYLTKIEMKCFVSNIFEALSYLERTFNRPNNNLKPTNILISENGAIFKISDIALRSMRSSTFPHKYIPPNINKNQRFSYNSYDFQKYDIFTFGILIMEVASLEFLEEDANIYENNELIKLNILHNIKERYGDALRDLVEMLLGNQGLALKTFKDCRKALNEYMVISQNYIILYKL